GSLLAHAARARRGATWLSSRGARPLGTPAGRRVHASHVAVTGPPRAGMMRAMRPPARFASLCLACALLATPTAARKARTPPSGLSPTERKLAQAVDRRLPAALA